MGWGKISVGFPWFTTMFVIFTPFLIIIMGLGPLARWKKQDPGDLARQLRIALLLSVAAGVLLALPILHEGNIWAGLAVMLSVWLLSSVVLSLRQRWRYRKGIAGILKDFGSRGSGSFYGMLIAHLGVAVFIIGVTFVTQFDVEQDIRMSPGQSVELAGHTFRFDGAKAIQGPNYRADQGTIRVFNSNDQEVAVLNPEKRTYLVQTKPMTEAGIDAGFTRDIYVSLGETLGNGDWSLRLYYKPVVRWIWLGGLMIAIGGLLAASDRRYRMAVARKTVPARAAAKQVAAEGGS
jgi:cytochrome c-type biogenesis protein CcmF